MQLLQSIEPALLIRLEVRDAALDRKPILVDGVSQPAPDDMTMEFDFLEEVQLHESGYCSRRSLPGL